MNPGIANLMKQIYARLGRLAKPDIIPHVEYLLDLILDPQAGRIYHNNPAMLLKDWLLEIADPSVFDEEENVEPVAASLAKHLENMKAGESFILPSFPR